MRPAEHPCLMNGKSSIYYAGPPASEGKKPAVIYFALSAEMSLYHDPFNQPVEELAKNDIRIFSWDLPYHGKDMDPHAAMHQWAQEFARNPTFISDFINECLDNLQFLSDQNLIDFSHLAVAGLSRGGFVATHLAAREPRIKRVLGFSPLTKPQPVEEFNLPASHYEETALVNLVDFLRETHVRYYIGNRDTRVSTDACYEFIKELAENSFEKGNRSPPAELIIFPSIGHKGHGTPHHIFLDGARWLISQLNK